MAKRTIEFECPRCKTKVSASINRIGHSMACPSCDRKLLVPAASTTKSAFDDLFDDGSTSGASDSDDEIQFADESTSSGTPANGSGSDDIPDHEDLSPIALDGISRLANFEETFTLKCKVCDSRIYVTPVNIGKTIECPDCYTKILVPKPKKKPSKAKPHQNPLVTENKLQVEDEFADFESPSTESVDPSFGLAPVMDDLLAPAPEEELDFESPDEDYEDDSADSSDDDSEIEVIDVIDTIEVDDPFADARLETDDLAAKADLAGADNRIDLDVDNDLGFGDELSLEPELTLPPEILHKKQKPKSTQKPELATNIESPEFDDDDEIELIDEPPEVANRRAEFAPKPKSKKQKSKKQKDKAEEKKKARKKNNKSAAKKSAPTPSVDDEEESEPPPRAHAANKTPKEKIKHGSPDPGADGFPSFEDYKWVEPAKAMVLGGGIPIWAGGAAVLMAIGSGLAHQISMNFEEVADATVMDRIFSSASWFLMGVLPFWIGVLLLWLVCSAIFREAALGRRQVDKFSIAAVSELKVTFLGFAFAFFVAGLPMFLFQSMYLTIPFRFFLASFLLLAVWHNQSAFNIVSTEAFSKISQMSKHWKGYMLAVFILSVLGIIGGVLMELPYFIIVWIGTFLGTILVTAITLVYAAITGWHCGYVSSNINEAD